MFRPQTRRAAATALALGLSAPTAWAADAYVRVPIGGLTKFEADVNSLGEGRAGWMQVTDEVLKGPYVVVDGGEGYLSVEQKGPFEEPKKLGKDTVLFARGPEGKSIRGKIIVPATGTAKTVSIPFEAATKPGDDDARKAFESARQFHFGRLARLGFPGSPWFRRQAGEKGMQAATDLRGVPGRPSELDRTLELFGGGRAISENLQLDRALLPPADTKETVETKSIEGITVAAIPWKERLPQQRPAVDPLASLIPADQHAVFVRGIGGVLRLFEEYRDLPASMNAEGRSEDTGVFARYQKQLAMGSMLELARSPLGRSIKSLALTGSDPFFPTGTDVAILFESPSPALLDSYLVSEIGKTGAPAASGTVAGLEYKGVRTPDRSISAYVMRVKDTVVLANNVGQLERIASTSKGATPSLASLDEFAYFRGRYALGKPDETAFVMLSDAAIRRWCGPAWRVGASRRIRAGALLQDLQAAAIPSLVQGKPWPEFAKPNDPTLDLGTIARAGDRVVSSKLGTIDDQAPIADMDLSRITKGEADAYARWRDGYQQNWRRYFDPIGMRFSATPERLDVDLTVMPLILRSDYRWMIDTIGQSKLRPADGDPHPEALLHAVLALDPNAPSMKQAEKELQRLDADLNDGQPTGVTLDWVGNSFSVYFDQSPVWAELANAKSPQNSFLGLYERTPIGLYLAVRDRGKILPTLRRLKQGVETKTEGMLAWKEETYKGVKVAKVSSTPKLGGQGIVRPFTIHAALTKDGLTLTLVEEILHRAIDRSIQRDEGKAPASPGWLGASAALRVDGAVIEHLNRLGQETSQWMLQQQSWSNLPILNEWHRLAPKDDPVALHERLWGSKLLCPGGGTYVWNESLATMESTALGCPAAPKTVQRTWPFLKTIRSVELGVDFEPEGLRGRTRIQRQVVKP